MSLNLNGNVTGIYLGSAKADAVYLGNVKVFEDTPPQETVTIGGKTYNVVKIGNQKWIAENLDYQYPGLTVNNGTTSSPCAAYYDQLYSHDPTDDGGYGWDGLKCGLLYNRYAVDDLNANASTLIPGWHIPSKSEFETLLEAVGGSSTAAKKLKAIDFSITDSFPSGFNGTDEFGFALLPSGKRDVTSFVNIGIVSYLWTSTDYGTNKGYSTYVTSADGFGFNSGVQKTNLLAIRLVKDT